MTLETLIRECQQREEAARETGQLLDGAKTYASFVQKLRALEMSTVPTDKAYTTAQAAQRLGVVPPTVAGYCAEGMFLRAYRTRGDAGPWRIPATDLAELIQSRAASTNQTADADPIDELDQLLEV